MCRMHATYVEMATKIRTAYILNSYLWAVAKLNPVAVYSSARSLMESHLITRLTKHLLDAARTGTRRDWRQRGRELFDVLLQSRYGTSDPEAQQFL